MHYVKSFRITVIGFIFRDSRRFSQPFLWFFSPIGQFVIVKQRSLLVRSIGIIE